MPAAYLFAPDLAVIQRCIKVPYPSRREAMRASGKWGMRGRDRSVVQYGVGSFGAYRCSICGAFHMGHERNSR